MHYFTHIRVKTCIVLLTRYMTRRIRRRLDGVPKIKPDFTTAVRVCFCDFEVNGLLFWCSLYTKHINSTIFKEDKGEMM